MNPVLEFVSKNRQVIAASAASLVAGFGLGYMVRANKYEKVEIDEEGYILTRDGEEVPRQVTFSNPEDGELIFEDGKPVFVPNSIKTADVIDIEAKVREQNRIDAEAREQKLIRDVFIEEGIPFDDYDTIIDDGFPTYPSGKPDPRDIVPAPKPDDNPEFNWDYELRKRERRTARTYVLHRDEFYANELEFDQISLTYYSLDNVMLDEDDQYIEDYSAMIGDLQFGIGSPDPAIFYVRNHDTKTEYEVLLLEESFSALS